MTAVLHGLLFLLKWLGILILVILGLVLLVVLLVLLAPVRYKGRLDKKEAPEEIFRADGLVSWLNPFLRVRVRFADKKLHYTVRIFGICLLNSDKPKKDKPVKEKKKKAKKAKKEKKKKQEPEKETTGTVSVGHETEGTGSTAEPAEKPPESQNSLSDTESMTTVGDNGEATGQTMSEVSEDSGESKEKKKGSLFAKIKQSIEKIKAIPEKIKQKVAHIVKTVKLLWHKKEKVVLFLQDELHKTAIGKAWDTIKQILRHVLPGKIKGRVEFGTGDPASTGKALGVLYAWYGKGVTVVPDFYEKRVVAELEFKGRIRFGTLLIKGLRLLRDKHVKRFINNFKKLLKVLQQKAE